MWCCILHMLTNTFMNTGVVGACGCEGKHEQQRPLWSGNSDRWQWSKISGHISCRVAIVSQTTDTQILRNIRWRDPAVVRFRLKFQKVDPAMSSPLPFLDSSDPRLKLMVQNRVRNVFVTQPDDTRWACTTDCKDNELTTLLCLTNVSHFSP